MSDSPMKVFRFFVLASLAGILLACQSKDDLTQGSIVDGNSVLSTGEQELLPLGSSFTVAFTANTSWELTGVPTWLTVNKTSGRSGTTSIKISAACNESRQDREATLKFEAKDGSFSSPLKVFQRYPYLNINLDSLGFNWNDCRTEKEGVVTDNNPQTIKISSNVAWRVRQISSVRSRSVDVDYFTLSADSGKDNYDLNIIPIRDNFNKEPYDITLELYPVVRDENGDETRISSAATDTYEIKLHQKNLRFLLNDSAEDTEITFSELNDDKNINVTIDSEIEWSVAECPSWVKMDKESGKNVVTVNFLVDGANPTKEVREGVIRLAAGSTGAYREIAVSQTPYIFELEGGEGGLNIENDGSGTHTLQLTTTGTWEIKGIPEWLTVTPEKVTQTYPESGTKTHKITLKAVGQNLDFEDYLKTIQVCSSMNSFTEDVSVKQDKFVFEVEPAKELADLPTMDVAAHKVTIASSGEWEFTNVPDWINVSQLRANGNSNLTIGAKNGNPDITTDRSATLTVVSLNHQAAGRSVSRTINVKQRKYTFEVTPADNVVLAAYKQNFTPFTTTVRCSAQWELVQYPTWITPSVTSGDGSSDVTISFTPATNVAKTGRSGVVKVRSLYNNEEKSFTVNQDGFVFDSENKSFDVVVMNTQSFPVSFDLTAEAGWTLTTDAEWLNPSVKSGSGSGSVTFTPAPNPDLKERKGQAIIHSTVSGEQKTIDFTQEKYVFDSGSETFNYTELDTKTNTVSITSSGPWTIKNAPAWMTLSARNGTGSTTITINPQKNTSLSSRNATFSVESTLNGLTKDITVNQAAYKFDSRDESLSYKTMEERTDNLKILSSGGWTAKSVPDWVTLSKTSGNGSEAGVEENLSITSKKNLTEADRQAVIQIVSNDNASLVKNITLRQDKFDFRVDNRTFAYTNPMDNSPRAINITCPEGADWTVTSDQPWVSLSVASGSGNGSVILSPQANLTTSDRSATITVTSTLNSLKIPVTLSQPKFIFEVDKSSHSFTSPLAAENESLRVNVQCSDDWTATTTDEWLTITPGQGNGNSSFTVAPKTNPTTSSRQGKITVTSTKNGLTKEITITQGAYQFDATAATRTFDAYDSSAQSVDVVCSGEWTITNTGSAWLTVTPSVTKGNGTVTLSAKDNVSNTGREAVVTITSKDSDALKKTITVTQTEYVFDQNAVSLSFDACPSSEKSVTVTSSGKWTVSSNQAWLTVTPAGTTTGNGSVTIKAEANPAEAPRTAVVTVTCSDNTNWKKTINVTQAAHELKLSAETLSLASAANSKGSVGLTTTGPWKATSNQSWCTISPASGTGNGTISVTVTENTGTADRSATITVSCGNTNLQKTVTVTQAKKAGQ